MIFVVCGIDGGVKLFSNVNMVIVFVLFVFVVFVGFLVVFGNFFNIVMGYVENIILLSNLYGCEDEIWMYGWIVFYWVWWILWLLFVGMFIVCVFEGCIICEFLIVVLFVFIVVIIFWMFIYGGIVIE